MANTNNSGLFENVMNDSIKKPTLAGSPIAAFCHQMVFVRHARRSGLASSNGYIKALAFYGWSFYPEKVDLQTLFFLSPAWLNDTHAITTHSRSNLRHSVTQSDQAPISYILSDRVGVLAYIYDHPSFQDKHQMHLLES